MPAAIIPPNTPAAQVNACWSKAGVWGRRDCPELPKFTHCRNCPVYAAAAAAMLDGLVPAGYIETWTEHFAAPKTLPERDTQSFLFFRIGVEWFALPVSALVEVVERRPLHSLPHLRSRWVKGVVNIRGQLLVCVSLTKLLRLAERTATQRASRTVFERLLVVTTDEGRLVLPVSEVASLSRCSTTRLREPPASVARAGQHFTRAVLPWRHHRSTEKGAADEDVNVAVLDAPRLFHFINGGLA